MRTRQFRPNLFAVVAALLGAAAFAAALVLKSIQVGRAPADYYGVLRWLAPEIGLAPFAVLLSVVAVILATAARDWRSSGVALLGSGLAAAGLVITFTHAPPNPAVIKSQCMENMKAISAALAAYEDDHGALPPAAHWTQALRCYIHDPAVWKEPLTGKPGYALNAAIVGRRADSFAADPADVVAVFESDRGADAAGGPELLSRQPRHYGGVHVAYLDGRCKWVYIPHTEKVQDLGLTWDPDAPPSPTSGPHRWLR